MTGIYCITNNLNGKKYVGKSEVDVEARLYEHRTTRRIGNTNEHLHRALHKYGQENFSFKIIEECEPDKCCQRERYWIEKLGSLYPNGYNYTSGGENASGFKFSEISRQRMSEARKALPNVSELSREAAYHRNWTDDQKAKVSSWASDCWKNPKPGYGPTGRVWVNNGKEQHTILPEELSQYIENGYVKGRLFKKRVHVKPI